MQKARACQNLDPGDPVSSELADIRGNIAWKPRSGVYDLHPVSYISAFYLSQIKWQIEINTGL